MRTLEGNDVGDQTMGVVQTLVHVGADIGLVVPAEGFEHFRDETLSVGFVETAVTFSLFGQFDSDGRKDPALGEDRL
ncbi:hypothetical protein D9M70_619640 [compost metagenome]